MSLIKLSEEVQNFSEVNWILFSLPKWANSSANLEKRSIDLGANSVDFLFQKKKKLEKDFDEFFLLLAEGVKLNATPLAPPPTYLNIDVTREFQFYFKWAALFQIQ